MLKVLKQIKVSKSMYKGMPYMLFLSALGMAYIANVHKAEMRMRQIQIMERQAEEKHWEYMSIRSEITFKATESQIERQVAQNGLTPAIKAPARIEK